jgi:hypothetical protein
LDAICKIYEADKKPEKKWKKKKGKEEIKMKKASGTPSAQIKKRAHGPPTISEPLLTLSPFSH